VWLFHNNLLTLRSKWKFDRTPNRSVSLLISGSLIHGRHLSQLLDKYRHAFFLRTVQLSQQSLVALFLAPSPMMTGFIWWILPSLNSAWFCWPWQKGSLTLFVTTRMTYSTCTHRYKHATTLSHSWKVVSRWIRQFNLTRGKEGIGEDREAGIVELTQQ